MIKHEIKKNPETKGSSVFSKNASEKVRGNPENLGPVTGSNSTPTEHARTRRKPQKPQKTRHTATQTRSKKNKRRAPNPNKRSPTPRKPSSKKKKKVKKKTPQQTPKDPRQKAHPPPQKKKKKKKLDCGENLSLESKFIADFKGTVLGYELY